MKSHRITGRNPAKEFVPFLCLLGLCMAACAGCSRHVEAQANNTLSEAEKKEGWRLLFDGEDLSPYQVFGSPVAGLDRWSVQGDTLSLASKPEGSKSKLDLIITEKPIEDFELSFEWNISPGGNGGVIYLVKEGLEYQLAWHTGLEMQLIDNDAYKGKLNHKNQNGDLYGLVSSSIDSTKPAGEWNHSRIIRKGNFIEHWMNGDLAVSIEMGTDDWKKRVSGSKFAPWPEFGKMKEGNIILQDHGDSIAFRNLKLKEL
ncbi:MAG: DUF1080 domain-containing protein [Verrucomicrobiae bacterium]|nr:DUF1080 domain-containing protein [Verrucomicrobiae bacterium]